MGGEDRPGLLTVPARVTDPCHRPCHRRGVRHRLAVILGLAVCAVLAGACSFTAIAEWAADADEQTLARLGVTGPGPSESASRRTLQRLDADTFDALAGRRAQPPGPHRQRPSHHGRPAQPRHHHLRLAGATSIAAALRHHARGPSRHPTRS